MDEYSNNLYCLHIFGKKIINLHDSYSTSSFQIVRSRKENEGNESLHQLAALIITGVWMYNMVILSDFPLIGIYLLMLKSVASILIIFFVLFSFIIIAFAFGFHLLVPGDGHGGDPFTSFITTLAMMFGELDYAGKFQPNVIVYHGATEIIIICFIIFIGIIIINFLIGLSIDNMTGLFQSAGVTRLKLTLQQVMNFF